jgi:beta-glucanase (GH16 family)
VNGANVTGINFTAIPVGTTYTISGTISPSTGGSGATVTLTGTAAAVTTANSSGNFTFSGVANGSYTVTPTSSGYSFSPTSLAVTVNSANVSGVNFTATASATVLFYDDFSGTTLSSSWFALNVYSGVNNEQECYQPSQVTVNNQLILTAIAQSVKCGGSTLPYTSGAVVWAPPLNFTYGTVEYQAKFAGGTGTWPAIWLLGHNCQPSAPTIYNANGCDWPQAGANEIDITEIKNGNFTQPYQNVINPSGGWITCQPTVTDVTKNYHVYGFKWTSTSLTWYIDGVQTCQVTDTSHIPSQPMYLIINVAVGGGGGGTVNNATLPQSTYVNYVKVTQP